MEFADLKQEQIDAYLKSDGVACPACESGNIEGHSVEIDNGIASQDVHCTDCAFEWRDLYYLVRIEAI